MEMDQYSAPGGRETFALPMICAENRRRPRSTHDERQRRRAACKNHKGKRNFPRPPGSGNYSSSIGAAQGIELFSGSNRVRRARPAKTVFEPGREIPIFAETDVLVVGGGPAGTAAAIAAARVGANVVLVERYNHLGGLSTGGLVIWIDRMTDWSGQHIIRGLAEEFMERLLKDAIQGPPRVDWGIRDDSTAAYWAQRTAAYHGIATWSPTIDPEALKTLSMRMVNEAKVRLLLHAWCAAPIVEDAVVRGAIFESKEGRHAVLAKVVVDTTGDADLIARSGAHCETDIDTNDIHHCMNTVFLFGGVDMERCLLFAAASRTRSPPSWRLAAIELNSSRSHSCRGATTSLCSWDRAWQATAQLMSMT